MSILPESVKGHFIFLLFDTMADTQVVKTTPQPMAVATVDEQSLREYLFGLKDPITEKQQNLFLQIAKANNLNPFKREVYAVGFGDNFAIVTGYQVYIDKANATGLLDGWEVEVIKDEAGKVTGARCIIYRKDWTRPFKWEVSLSEFARTFYDKDTKTKKMMKQWAEKPEFMIKKVGIGQGFRLCFPTELGSLPYLAEEITDKNDQEVKDNQVDADVVETPPKTPASPKKTAKPADVSETKVETPAETVAEPVKTEPQAVETSPEVQTPATTKLPANKVKEVQSKWKEFAEKKGWKQEESDKRKKATLNKYYQIESVNELTIERADDFVAKLDKAIEAIVY